MGGFVLKLRNWWENATNAQRYGTIGGALFAIVLLYGIVSVASQPKYQMLYGGLSQTDQANIVSEVQTMGVPVKYDQPGQVLVPADKLPEVRMKLALAGKLPKSSHPGNAELGQMSLYTTPAVERERLKTILQGELATSIETMAGIRSARVHITLGDPSPFGEQRRQATASINISTENETPLSKDQSKGIALLVANAVDGLSISNVVVLNEKMEAIFNGREMEGSENIAEHKLDLERQIAKGEERRLQNVLDTMFGAGSTLVTVRAEVDLDEETSRVSERSYLPVKKGSIEIQKAVEKMPLEGGAPTGTAAAGADANLQAPAATANATGTGAKGEYVNEVSRVEPGIKETTKDTKKATGAIKSMVINVAADVSKFRKTLSDPVTDEETEYVRSVTDFVRNEFATKVGEDANLFSARVTPIIFDNSSKLVAEKAQKDAESAARNQQIISLLPVLALVAIGFMVAKQVSKYAKSHAVGLPAVVTPEGIMVRLPSGQLAPMPEEQLSQVLASTQEIQNPALAQALNRSSSGINASDELAASLEQIGVQEALKGEGIEFEESEERIRIAKIKERTSIPLEQIKQMGKERPEAVAMLVKSWLAEERR